MGGSVKNFSLYIGKDELIFGFCRKCPKKALFGPVVLLHSLFPESLFWPFFDPFLGSRGGRPGGRGVRVTSKNCQIMPARVPLKNAIVTGTFPGELFFSLLVDPCQGYKVDAAI